MINIKNNYDVILTYSPIIEVTGHIFECFDYYLYLRQYCNVGVLFFNSLNIKSLEVLWNSKYNIDFSIIKPNLLFLNLNDIKSTKQNIIKFNSNTKVLITDGNILEFEYNKIFLATKKLYGFLCQDTQYNLKMHKSITYLQDYRIYGKNPQYKSINYIKKIPFKFYKKTISPNKNIGMIYVTYVCRKVEPKIIEQYHKKSGCSKSFLIVPYKLPEYDIIENVEQVEAPIENLFDKFDTYIYTPINRKFDCSPRLITECFIHNKKVFKDLDYYDIGLETRYNDCINNLEQLNLKENDKILEILNI